MILTTILLIVAITATIIALVAAGTVGAAVMVVFGDVIVFALVMWLIIKLIKKKK